jgi:hypothetical protein
MVGLSAAKRQTLTQTNREKRVFFCANGREMHANDCRFAANWGQLRDSGQRARLSGAARVPVEEYFQRLT